MTKIRFAALFFGWLISTPLWALDLIRVRSDPFWALLNNNVNVELDFAWTQGRTLALALYYSDGWDPYDDIERIVSPAVRIDFNATDPLSSGWHPNIMLQTDWLVYRDGGHAAAVRVKARQSYRWVIDPLSISLGLGAQARTGAAASFLDCYLCPTYELSLGWAL